MDSLEMEARCLDDPFVRRHYRGTYALDQLPSELAAGGVYCLNLDPSSRPGIHWCGIANKVENLSSCVYFDSFGRPPPEAIRESLFSNAKYIYYNDAQIQNVLSEVCGELTILCLMLLCRGHSLLDILTKFFVSPDYLFINDPMAQEAIRRMQRRGTTTRSKKSIN